LKRLGVSRGEAARGFNGNDVPAKPAIAGEFLRFPTTPQVA